MQKNYAQLLLGIIIGLVSGLLLSKLVFKPTSNTNAQTEIQQQKNQDEFVKNNNRNNNNQNNDSEENYNEEQKIPKKVYEVLKYVKENNRAMDGYVGGREFSNREKNLPITSSNGEKIRYQEWDVNPKEQGKNRGTQRMCTGDDGRSWYTNNHYKSFTEIK